MFPTPHHSGILCDILFLNVLSFPKECPILTWTRTSIIRIHRDMLLCHEVTILFSKSHTFQNSSEETEWNISFTQIGNVAEIGGKRTRVSSNMTGHRCCHLGPWLTPRRVVYQDRDVPSLLAHPQPKLAPGRKLWCSAGQACWSSIHNFYLKKLVFFSTILLL